MSVRVVKPGLLTTVQDSGRTGFQKYGVIVSGAMDAFAYRVANLVVGNEHAEAALEITLVGPTLQFDSTHVVSICGADLSPSIDGKPVPLWRPVVVKKGSLLRFGAARQGARCYLAVSGGFDLPRTMGSYSTYLRAGIGGFEGRALQEGDVLAVKPANGLGQAIADKLAASGGEGPFSPARWQVFHGMMPDYRPDPVIRVVEGPQMHWFDPESVADFFTGTFRVLPQSDRMGYRLQGEPLRLAAPSEMISEPVAFGTVQVPPDGNPIVLMADRQTTGGYPKIAQVITVDLPLMAQVPIGGSVRFRPVSLREAQELYWIAETELDLLKTSILMQFR
jgi:antagonist of KipI